MISEVERFRADATVNPSLVAEAMSGRSGVEGFVTGIRERGYDLEFSDVIEHLKLDQRCIDESVARIFNIHAMPPRDPPPDPFPPSSAWTSTYMYVHEFAAAELVVVAVAVAVAVVVVLDPDPEIRKSGLI